MCTGSRVHSHLPFPSVRPSVRRPLIISFANTHSVSSKGREGKEEEEEEAELTKVSSIAQNWASRANLVSACQCQAHS